MDSGHDNCGGYSGLIDDNDELSPIPELSQTHACQLHPNTHTSSDPLGSAFQLPSINHLSGPYLGNPVSQPYEINSQESYTEDICLEENSQRGLYVSGQNFQEQDLQGSYAGETCLNDDQKLGPCAPGSYTQGQYLPGSYPQRQYLPGPQGQYPPGSYPEGQYLSGSNPQGQNSMGSFYFQPPAQQQQFHVFGSLHNLAVDRDPHVSTRVYKEAMCLACFVFWCCMWFFGLLAVIMAASGKRAAENGAEPTARCYLHASYGLSIAGILTGMAVTVVVIFVSLQASL